MLTETPDQTTGLQIHSTRYQAGRYRISDLQTHRIPDGKIPTQDIRMENTQDNRLEDTQDTRLADTKDTKLAYTQDARLADT